MTKINWGFLARFGFLVTVFAYMFLLGGGFSALVDVRIQTITTAIAIVVLGSWLVWRLAHRQLITASGLEFAIALFIATQMAGVAASEDPRRSLPVALTWVAYFLVFYFLLDLLRNHWESEYFQRAALIGGFFVLIVGLGELTGQYSAWLQLAALEFLPSFQYRVQGVLGDPNLLAAFANLFFPIALALFIRSGILGKILTGLFGAISLLILFFTDSRGGLLGFAASLVVFAVLWVAFVSQRARDNFRKAWDYVWRRKGLLVGLFAMSAFALVFFAWRMLSFQGDTTHAPALTARDIYWEAATNALESDPATGAGPGMYPVYLMKIWSTPPARPYLHAHSLPFQVAAESGWLGLGSLVVLIGSFVWRAWKVLPELDDRGKQLWAIGLASLAGLATHSLVDDFVPFAAVGVLAMLMMVFVLRGRPSSKSRHSAFSPTWLLGAGLILAAVTGYALRASWMADNAITAGARGDWGQAAEQMQMAVAADPGAAIYWLQSGYAHAMQGEYEAAITDYQQGIEVEPVYGLNHANLGMLYYEAGDFGPALDEMRIATSLSPEAWQFWLARGQMEEALGDEESAASSYLEALKMELAIGGSNFWLSNSLRTSVLEGFVAPEAEDTAKALARHQAQEAMQAIKTGDLERADELLVAAWQLNDQEPRVYVGFAQLAQMEGDPAGALQYLQAALWVPTTNNQAKIEAILLAAQIKAEMGEGGQALELYQTAFERIFENSSYGWGGANWTPYTWFVFQRRSFPEDMLPLFFRADISMDVAERLLVLADLYEAEGEDGLAEKVRLTLRPYLPQ